ncbi:MAG: M23 family metallopeptidase [Chthoniobacteraceae bacterium]
MGEYLHLQKNGVLVKVGDEVQAGDLVARSGNTGCSTGPHLHFHVR